MPHHSVIPVPSDPKVEWCANSTSSIHSEIKMSLDLQLFVMADSIDL